MKVIETKDYQYSGRRIEDDNSVVVRPVSEVTITLKRTELQNLLVDLADLDPARTNGTTELLIASLKATSLAPPVKT